MDTLQECCGGCGVARQAVVGAGALTYVCDHCGAVCGGGGVVAEQDMARGRAEHPPLGPLRLGQTVRIAGDGYQLVGRERVVQGDYFWDRWVLYSETTPPMWLIVQRDRCLLLHRYDPTYEVDPWGDSDQVQLDDRGPAQVVDRGSAVIAFIEGEHLTSVQPNDEFDSAELTRYGLVYLVENQPDGMLYYSGKRRDPSFPAGLVGSGEPDPTSALEAGGETPVPAPESAPELGQWKHALIGLLCVGVALVFFSVVFYSCSSLQKTWTVGGRKAMDEDGVLLTQSNGAPEPITLPWSAGAYAFKLKSSTIPGRGTAGGACWWAQIEVLKKGSAGGLRAQREDPYVVVHKVNVWFGRYWGRDREGYSWDESERNREHDFRTRDKGPYYLRVYTGNCTDVLSMRLSPATTCRLTIELHSNVLMVRWPLFLGLLIIVVISGLLYKARYWHSFFGKGQ